MGEPRGPGTGAGVISSDIFGAVAEPRSMGLGTGAGAKRGPAASGEMVLGEGPGSDAGTG